ncbi:MAG: TetR family transcriptional regulator, partial [Lutimaribacter sp.]
MSEAPPTAPKRSRIQQRNRKRILEAALDVFSQHGYRGSTLDQIAEAAGTPVYVYSAGALTEAYQRFANALDAAGLNARICYAMKANS